MRHQNNFLSTNVQLEEKHLLPLCIYRCNLQSTHKNVFILWHSTWAHSPLSLVWFMAAAHLWTGMLRKGCWHVRRPSKLLIQVPGLDVYESLKWTSSMHHESREGILRVDIRDDSYGAAAKIKACQMVVFDVYSNCTPRCKSEMVVSVWCS